MCVDEAGGERVQSSVLYSVFAAWCKSSGETAWKQKGFSLAMEERGYKRLHSNVTWFLDIKLIKLMHDFVDANDHPVAMAADGKRTERQDVGDVEIWQLRQGAKSAAASIQPSQNGRIRFATKSLSCGRSGGLGGFFHTYMRAGAGAHEA